MTDDRHGCDLLCVSPHTDDAEIALGGTLALLADRGRRVWLHDLTRGELGSNGSPDERWGEAAEASRVLGVAGRVQGTAPDGFVGAEDPQQVAAVAAVIRALRPRWVVAAPMPNRHPDHRAVGALVRKAAFMARLAAWSPGFPELRVWEGGEPIASSEERWEPEAVFEVPPVGAEPTLVFDVSDVWDRKTAALRCYASQFAAREGRRATMINDPAFLEAVETWARGWGFRSGVRHAEALRAVAGAHPVLHDLPAERWT